MSSTERIDSKLLSDELNKLIDIIGDNYGPLMIEELQRRIDKTIDIFNKEVQGLFKNSFEDHNNKMNTCREILNEKKI